jgi:hypothetical protein
MINWLADKILPETAAPEPPLWQTTVRSAPDPAGRKLRTVQPVEFTAEVSGRIEDGGPGKNVLIRSKYARGDADTHDTHDTHDTLRIISNPDSEQDEEYGDDPYDPYNTGSFDRTNSWKTYRSRK